MRKRPSSLPPGILLLLLLPPLAIPYILVLLLLLFPVSYSPVLYKGGEGEGGGCGGIYARASVCVPFLLLFYSVDPSMSRPNKAVQCMGEYHCTVGSGGCSPLFSPEPSESEAEATTGGGREGGGCMPYLRIELHLPPPSLELPTGGGGRERGVGGQGKTQEG